MQFQGKNEFEMIRSQRPGQQSSHHLVEQPIEHERQRFQQLYCFVQFNRFCEGRGRLRWKQFPLDFPTRQSLQLQSMLPQSLC